MAKLTITQMLTRLSRNIEDDNNSLFTAAQKVDILNEAQNETVIKVPFRTLSTLFVSTTAQVIDSSSSFDLSTLTDSSLGLLRFPDGLSEVRFTGGAVLHLVTQTEIQQIGYIGFGIVNTDSLFSTSRPKYRIEGNNLIVIPSSTSGSETLDIKWYREPLAMVDSSVSCELNDYIQFAMIDWAEFKCFMIQENFSRAQQSWNNWAARVREINIKFPNTQSATFPKLISPFFPGNDGSGFGFPAVTFQ
jgi:hypothetical protein